MFWTAVAVSGGLSNKPDKIAIDLFDTHQSSSLSEYTFCPHNNYYDYNHKKVKLKWWPLWHILSILYYNHIVKPFSPNSDLVSNKRWPSTGPVDKLFVCHPFDRPSLPICRDQLHQIPDQLFVLCISVHPIQKALLVSGVLHLASFWRLFLSGELPDLSSACVITQFPDPMPIQWIVFTNLKQSLVKWFFGRKSLKERTHLLSVVESLSIAVQYYSALFTG